MSGYQKLVDKVLSEMSRSQSENRGEESFRQLINELKLSHKDIAHRQCANIDQSKTYRLVSGIMSSGNDLWYGLFRQFLQLLYLKESKMLLIIYQFVPTMLRLFIQNKDNKTAGLGKAVRVIQSYQLGNYNRYVKQKQQIHNSPFVKDLYSIHFNSKLQVQIHQPQKLIEESSNQVSRELAKAVLLFVVYRNIDELRPLALKQYMKMIYLYCGGELKDYQNIASFYLLEKKNLFNPFRYSITEEQTDWMLLTLYELSIGSSRDRFQLLAAVNMIYKKTANESMFRQAEIAQSILHILEDQYLDIFS